MTLAKHIVSVALAGAGLLAADPAAATVVAHELSGTQSSFPSLVWGESFMTPGGASFHDITINFYAASGGSLAAGTGYLFAAPYAATPAGLATAGALAASLSSAGGVWSFAPAFTLAPATRYYFFEDTPLPSLIGDAVSATGDGYFVAFNVDSNFASLGPNDINYSVNGFSSVPEPAAWGLMLAGLGLGGLTLRGRRTVAI